MSDETAVTEDGAPSTPKDRRRARRGGWVGEAIGIFWLVVIVLGFHTLIAKPFYIPSESMLPGLLVGDRLVVTKFPYGWSYISPTFHVLPFTDGRLLGSLPQRGDVVIVTPPGSEEDWIKRVIGVPGDRLEVRDGTVILNGKPARRGPAVSRLIPIDANTRCDPNDYPGARVTGADGRPYCRLPIVRETLPTGVSYDTVDLGDTSADHYGPITVPADTVFLMGDNRDRSADSRVPAAVGGLGGPVRWEQLGGRAEFITFSLDGSGSWNPISWPASFRSGRAGTSLRPSAGQ